MSKRFLGKNAIVTGGSRGIGRAIALGLAKEGAKVCIGYNNGEEAARETVDLLKEHSGFGFMHKVNQEDISQVEGFVSKCLVDLGNIHILVNNAGICPFKDFFEITPELLQRVWNVNVASHFFITKLVARHMIDNKIDGRILMISSISAHVGGELQAHYTTTKSALNGLMHSLAIILGKYGILVNSLEPGTIVTDINRENLANEEKKKSREKRTVLGRLGTPDDMIGPALFLVSDENTYTTGIGLLSDGGMLINF
jgi:L-rhamnose 1-dehydrogenase